MGAGCCSVVKTDETRQKKSMRQPDSRGNDKAYVQQKIEQALKLKQLMIQDVTVSDLA